MAVKVDWEQKPDRSIAREEIAALREIDSTSRVNIHEHGHAAGANDGERGGKSGERRGEHFVAWTQAEAAQPNLERIEAVPGSDRVSPLAENGQFLFEGFNFCAENIPAACAHAADGAEHLLFHELPLTFEVVWPNRLRAPAHPGCIPRRTTECQSRMTFAIGISTGICSMHGTR